MSADKNVKVADDVLALLRKQAETPGEASRRLAMMFDFLGLGDLRVLEILAFKALFPLRFYSRLRKFTSAQRKT